MLRQFTVIYSWPLLLLVLSVLATTIVVVSAQDIAGSRLSTDSGRVFIPFAAKVASILDRTGLQSIQGMIAVAAICGLIPIAHWFNRTRTINDDQTTLISKLYHSLQIILE